MRPRYAELRRTSREVASTPKLPNVISLQQPIDSVEHAVTIGRHRANSVHLDCTHVYYLLSRQHASIKLQPDGVHTVTDNDTVNGTYLNGNLIPLGPCLLEHGDVVAFGGPTDVSRVPPHLSSARSISLSALLLSAHRGDPAAPLCPSTKRGRQCTLKYQPSLLSFRFFLAAGSARHQVAAQPLPLPVLAPAHSGAVAERGD